MNRTAAEQQLDELHGLEISIKRALGREHLNKYYCEKCLRNTIPDELRRSICCGGALISRADAETKIRVRIEAVAKRVRATKEKSEKRILKSRERTLKSAGDRKITIVFQDESFDFADAKRARKWLRNHDKTVRDAEKDDGTWYFDEPFRSK